MDRRVEIDLLMYSLLMKSSFRQRKLEYSFMFHLMEIKHPQLRYITLIIMLGSVYDMKVTMVLLFCM